MLKNLEKFIDKNQGRGKLDRSSFFWKDTGLFEGHIDRHINTLIALRQVLAGYSEGRDLTEIQEFIEIFDRLATDTESFALIWRDPAAYHWCQLAFELVKTVLTGKPLPEVTRRYCLEIGQKTPLESLTAHLNGFKIFALAHGFLSGQGYKFKTPFGARLPLALPGTTLYLEGEGTIEIGGIDGGKLEFIGNGRRQQLELTPGATSTDARLRVGRCPFLELEGWELRLQPYCFNSPAFPDGRFVIATGIEYQEKYIPLVREGLALIDRYHPDTFRQLPYFARVMGLKPIGVGTFTNLSSSDFPGAFIWSVVDNPYRAADNFIHEFHHNRLFLIEQNNPLLLDSVEDGRADNLYYSPWRFDSRPLRGIFHAIYVYTPVVEFWLNIYRSDPTGELRDFATCQLVKIPLQLRLGLEQLQKYARFTPLGEELFNELQQKLLSLNGEIELLGIPTDVPDLDFQRDGSFIYNLQKGTSRLLTVKEALSEHILHFDRFRQIDPETRTRLGSNAAGGEIREKIPAIVYGEKLTGRFEVVPSLAETLLQKIDRHGGGKLTDLAGEGGITRTYGELRSPATSLLGYLRSRGLVPGNFVIVSLEDCHDFIVAVWACFLGGFVPVPVSSLSRLQKIRRTLENPVILTSGDRLESLREIMGDDDPGILLLEDAKGFPPSDNFHRGEPEALALLLASSGTTGEPKLISFDAITVAAQFLGEGRKEEPSYRFLSWIPFDNASGFDIINPRASDTLYLPAKTFFGNPLFLLDIIDRYRVGGTVLTNFAMTEITREVERVPERRWDLQCLETIGLGAEKIVAKSCRAFLRVLQPSGLRSDVLSLAYGLSETGVIASTRRWKAMAYEGGNEQFVEIGSPLPGRGIRIVSAENNLLDEGEVGRIQIWSSHLTGGYYSNITEHRAVFTEDDWFDTGDLGFLQNGRLTVVGRDRDIVIINGKNYSCQEIESTIEGLEGIESSYTVACSFRKPDSDTDSLGIFFNTSLAGDDRLAELARNIRGKLTETLGINPDRLIPVEKSGIPRTTTGKIKRIELQKRLENGEFQTIVQRIEALIRRSLEDRFVPPRNEIESRLIGIWEKVLEVRPIGIYHNFFNLGGQSIVGARLLNEIKETFGRDLPLGVLYQAPTVAELAGCISREEPAQSHYSLVPIQPLGDKTPLFAIHLLGEGLSFYRPLAKYLGTNQPIYGLSYGLAARGGEDKEVPLPPIEELAAHYIQEMKTLQPRGPYILLGVSNGGNVAFEMAKQLYDRGETVDRLILFDTIHPNLKLPKNWQNMSKLYKTAWDNIRHIKINIGNLQLLESGERLPYLLDKIDNFLSNKGLKNNNKSSDETREEREEKTSRRLAYRTYIPSNYPGKIILFRGKNTAITVADPMNGWEGVAAGGLEIYSIHGAHSKILAEPSIRVLAEKLRHCLDRVEG